MRSEDASDHDRAGPLDLEPVRRNDVGDGEGRCSDRENQRGEQDFDEDKLQGCVAAAGGAVTEVTPQITQMGRR